MEISKDKGYVELQAGVYACSAEHMQQEQLQWSDSDPCKKIDFSVYKFWLTTDNGGEPDGFDSIQDILEVIN